MKRPRNLTNAELVQWIDDNSIPEPNSGCLLWLGSMLESGYGNIGYDGTVWRVHRLKYALTHNDFDPELYTLHKCDVKLCHADHHIYQGTQKRNVQDALERGLFACVLSEDQVREIRVLAETTPYKDLALRYNVHEKTIGKVYRRERWDWIK